MRSKEHKIEASVKKEASELKISNVLVAVSGGADSVAALLALRSSGLNVKAMHCNFHLRGEESNRDMKFVMALCKEHGIPLETIEFDTEKFLSYNKGMSVEMACRKLRFEWFEKRLEECGYDRIVTGHNADDNIETFFINMLRGSGTRGLKGMISDNGKIWRPLLSFHRNEIVDYLQCRKQEFIVDSTNLSCDYRRNILRNRIIPLFKEEWKGFDNVLDKTISNLSEENKIVEDYISSVLPSDEAPLSVEKILNSPSPLLLIKRYISKAGEFSTTHKEILSAIKANKPHIRRWRLINGMVILRNGYLSIEMGHGESHS